MNLTTPPHQEIEGVNFWSRGFKTCPDCGNDKFQEGPHGGMSINFRCSNCLSEFNDMGPFGIERISGSKAQPDRVEDQTT